jgi:hypothetical protein
MPQPESRSFNSDFVGRISNISLSPSANNALAPLYEAITNGIQAIEDKFGRDNLALGQIDIYILRDGSDINRPTGFKVVDNGVGFTHTNLSAFLTSDTRNKIKRGGKGVGRFLWLKVFKEAKIESRYGERPYSKLSFDFVLAERDQVRNITDGQTHENPGTSVTLHPFYEEYAAHCPSKMSTLRNKLIGHFISYFLNLNAPKFLLHDINDTIDLFDVFTEAAVRDQDFPFDARFGEKEESFILHAFLLPKEFSDDERGDNAVFYGAHGRSVQRVDLDGAIGLKKISGECIYLGYVESNFQNGIVNQERTHLSWPGDTFDDVHRHVIEATKTFLAEEIKKIRQIQASRIEAIRNEHLRFLNLVENPEEFAETIHLSTQKPEDIYLEMSRAALRQYNRSKHSFHDAVRKQLPNLDQKAKEFTTELKSECVSSLAEYVMKRKLILDVFEERLKYKNIDDEKHYFEEAVHEIICPLRESKQTLTYDDHNLWIVDDTLAFYTYFASDNTVKSLTGGDSRSTQEPDIAIFDLGLGFDHAGSSDPISIVEFKRPGRDDYSLQKNPFVQVRRYVTELRKAGRAVATDGTEIREIRKETPFMCFVVADITPTLREMMDQFGPFHQKAGHGSFYKWDEGFSTFIEVASYKEVLRGAQARNHAFFKRLGLTPL